MKKVIVVPDVHGRDNWKQLIPKLENGEIDEVVFIGDYFDDYNKTTGGEQIINFNEIFSFYKENSERVTILVGNHDLSYINFDLACSGFQNGSGWAIHNTLRPLWESGEIKACTIKGEYLFSHAGVTKTWLNKYGIGYEDLNGSELMGEINDLFKKDIYAFGFQQDKSTRYPNPYGDNNFQSPMWVRPKSLKEDKLEKYTYVVGHTFVNTPVLEEGCWFTDCHQTTPNEFLTIEVYEY